MPVVYLSTDIKGLFLYEWERKKLENAANEKNIPIEIIPSAVIFDLKRNISIVIDWYLEGVVCPFLKNNRCLIYDNRPAECKKYPLDCSFNPEQNKLKFSFLECLKSNEKNSWRMAEILK